MGYNIYISFQFRFGLHVYNLNSTFYFRTCAQFFCKIEYYQEIAPIPIWPKMHPRPFYFCCKSPFSNVSERALYFSAQFDGPIFQAGLICSKNSGNLYIWDMLPWYHSDYIYLKNKSKTQKKFNIAIKIICILSKKEVQKIIKIYKNDEFVPINIRSMLLRKCQNEN